MFMIIKKHKLQMFLVKTTKILENLIIWCTIIVRCNLLKCIFTHRIYDKMWVGIIRATSILMWNVDFVSKEQNICVAVSEWPFVCDHSSHLVSSFFRVYFCSTSHTIAQMCIAFIVWQNFLRIWVLHHLHHELEF